MKKRRHKLFKCVITISKSCVSVFSCHTCVQAVGHLSQRSDALCTQKCWILKNFFCIRTQWATFTEMNEAPSRNTTFEEDTSTCGSSSSLMHPWFEGTMATQQEKKNCWFSPDVKRRPKKSNTFQNSWIQNESQCISGMLRKEYSLTSPGWKPRDDFFLWLPSRICRRIPAGLIYSKVTFSQRTSRCFWKFRRNVADIWVMLVCQLSGLISSGYDGKLSHTLTNTLMHEQAEWLGVRPDG